MQDALQIPLATHSPTHKAFPIHTVFLSPLLDCGYISILPHVTFILFFLSRAPLLPPCCSGLAIKQAVHPYGGHRLVPVLSPCTQGRCVTKSRATQNTSLELQSILAEGTWEAKLEQYTPGATGCHLSWPRRESPC